MTTLKSFRAAIDLWPTYGAMATDIGFGCSDSRVQKWWERDNIPSAWWSAVLGTKRAKAAGLSLDGFAELAARGLPDLAALAGAQG